VAARPEQRIAERDDALTLAEQTREVVEFGCPDEWRSQLVLGERDKIRVFGSHERCHHRSTSARAAARAWRRRSSARLEARFKSLKRASLVGREP
jgi:hypothetical protein